MARRQKPDSKKAEEKVVMQEPQKVEKQPSYRSTRVEERALGSLKTGRGTWWSIGIVILVISILVFRNHHQGSVLRSTAAVHVFPAGRPPVLSGYDLVQEDVEMFSLMQPFYTPAELDSFRQGDILHITVEGEGIWRQVPDPTQTVFHKTFRLSPLGPRAVVNRNGDEVVIPQGRINAPKDLPAGYHSKEFPHREATMGALIATIGTVGYDSDGMMKRHNNHFIVGNDRWLSVNGRTSKDAKLLFTLNIRWKEISWKYNEGLYQIRTQVYRPRAAVLSEVGGAP